MIIVMKQDTKKKKKRNSTSIHAMFEQISSDENDIFTFIYSFVCSFLL